MLASYFWDIHQACVVCTHTLINHFQISCITQINHCFFLYRSVIHEALSLKSKCMCPTMKASIMRATCFPGAGPQFSSVAQLCPTLCNSMNYSTPGLPVHHQLLEFIKLMSIESVMSSNHLVLCHPLLFLPSIFPSIRVFSNELALCIQTIGTSVAASALQMNIQS